MFYNYEILFIFGKTGKLGMIFAVSAAAVAAVAVAEGGGCGR